MLTAEENVVLPLKLAGREARPRVGRRVDRPRSASPTASRTARPSSRAASSSESPSRVLSSRSRPSCSPTSRPGNLDSTDRRGDPRAPPRLGRRPRPDDGHGHPRRAGGCDRRPRPLPRGRPDRQGSRADRRSHEILEAMEEVSADMMGVTLRGLAGRKIRAVLTALAIVLGVSMVSGTYVLTDTFHEGLQQPLHASPTPSTDAVVSGKSSSSSPRGERPGRRHSRERPRRRFARCPSVELPPAGSSTPVQLEPAQLLDADGKKIGGNGGAPTFGVGLDSSELAVLAHSSLTAGPLGDRRRARWSSTRAPRQRGLHASGTRSAWPPSGPVKQLRDHRHREVRRASTRSAARPSPSSTCRRRRPSSARKGKFDSISVAAKEGSSPEQLVQEARAARAGDCRGADRRRRRPRRTRPRRTTASTFITYFLLGFGGIALFVGAFVIFNTLSITVAQRTREFATLRTLGGSRRQVLCSVVIEAFVIGLLASMIGLGPRARRSAKG